MSSILDHVLYSVNPTHVMMYVTQYVVIYLKWIYYYTHEFIKSYMLNHITYIQMNSLSHITKLCMQQYCSCDGKRDLC